jgi:uncharacterized protein YndB with AHSA1/START domain
MTDEKFVYVIYIRTTPEKLWDALTQPEFTRQYWCETWQDSTWQPGTGWKLMIPDGRVGDAGEIVEAVPPKRLVLKWRNEFIPEMKAEGYSQCTFELEPQGDTVKLTVLHTMEKPGTKFLESISGGWPAILSSLKSLLETGEAIEATRYWPKEM